MKLKRTWVVFKLSSQRVKKSLSQSEKTARKKERKKEKKKKKFFTFTFL
jgi:hypothetical protein